MGKHLTQASLFSGIGGFDLAAEWAGFDNSFNCEIDPFCSQILNYYFPNATQYGDIKTTDFTTWRGKIDILTGGFPCQPFSLAGQRKGTDDDRYLWPEMLRAISEIRPTWVIGENVGGIVSMVQPGCEVEVATEATLFGEDYYTTEERQEFIIERICRDIENLGYSIQPILIPACGVGAPHRRDRVWFVAENTQCVRCDGDQSEEEPSAGRFGEFGAGDHVWVCREARLATHSNGQRLQSRVNSRTDGRRHPQVGIESFNGTTGWMQFPTQSPVCRGDDGLSDRLDIEAVYAGLGAKRRLTARPYPRWRQAAIKGFGNAVVPQVPFQIMEAIREIEQN